MTDDDQNSRFRSQRNLYPAFDATLNSGQITIGGPGNNLVAPGENAANFLKEIAAIIVEVLKENKGVFKDEYGNPVPIPVVIELDAITSRLAPDRNSPDLTMMILVNAVKTAMDEGSAAASIIWLSTPLAETRRMGEWLASKSDLVAFEDRAAL